MSPDGLTLAIAALYNKGHDFVNNVDAGHVRIFSFEETTWNQLPGVIDGENAPDLSGQSVQGISISKMDPNKLIVAVGSDNNDDGGIMAGHTRVFEYDGISSWLQLGNDIDGLER